MLLQYMHVKPVRHRIKVVAAYATYEAVALQVLLHRLQLISQFTECINDQT